MRSDFLGYESVHTFVCCIGTCIPADGLCILFYVEIDEINFLKNVFNVHWYRFR